MYLQKISSSDNIYQNWVEKHGTVFHQVSWLELYGDSLSLYGIFSKDKQLIGAFFFAVDNHKIIQHLKTPQFAPHNGLVFLNNATNAAVRSSFNKEVIELIAESFPKKFNQVTTLVFPTWITDLQPFYWRKYKVIVQYTYTFDLNLSVEELNARMAPKLRNNIRKAEQDGVETNLCEDKKTVLDLILKSLDRKKVGIDKEILQKVLNNFSNAENSFAFVATHQGKPIASSFFLYDKNRCYYLLGGYDPADKHSGGGAGCIWKGIQHAKSLGIKIFDFEGSMIPEVEKYFRSFGAEITPYFMITKSNLFLEVLLKIVKRNYF